MDWDSCRYVGVICDFERAKMLQIVTKGQDNNLAEMRTKRGSVFGRRTLAPVLVYILTYCTFRLNSHICSKIFKFLIISIYFGKLNLRFTTL